MARCTHGETVPRSGIGLGQRVLDLGSGVGDVALIAARLVILATSTETHGLPSLYPSRALRRPVFTGSTISERSNAQAIEMQHYIRSGMPIIKTKSSRCVGGKRYNATEHLLCFEYHRRTRLRALMFPKLKS